MRDSSAESVATISLPQVSVGMACSAQKARVAATPRAQNRALWLPGA